MKKKNTFEIILKFIDTFYIKDQQELFNKRD